MTGPIAGVIIMSLFLFGVRLGWQTDWVSRLFRLGPYKRPPKVPYRWID